MQRVTERAANLHVEGSVEKEEEVAERQPARQAAVRA